MKTLNKLIFMGVFAFVLFALALGAPGVVNAQSSCSYHAYQKCLGSNLYWYNSCGQQQDFIQTCAGGCFSNSCQSYNSCTYHAYQKCVGGSLYWYNSCDQQENYIQACSDGCYGNNCQNNYNNYNYNNNYNNYVPPVSCTYHAYKLCQGNSVYWYDSCGNQQDLYYNCGNGQACQYGQCSAYIQPAPVTNYNAYYGTKCYGDSLYWYDSFGVISGLYKKGACAASSPAPTPVPTVQPTVQPVAQNKCGNGTCETTLGETSANCPNDCKPSSATGLSVSFLDRESSAAQWQKTASVGSGGQIYFMVSVQNSSATPTGDVTVSSNIPAEVYSLGNVQVNGVPFLGDIVSGINIGSISASSSKTLTFEGKTQTIPSVETKQATATINASGATQSDSVSIEFNPNPAAAAISGTPAASGFMAFLKRWYLWILGALILIFLFVIVFKRLSSEN